MLRNLLGDRGIALKAGAYAEKIEHGKLHLHPRATLEVDQVVTLAQLEGPALPGLASDASGFIAVDEHSLVTRSVGATSPGQGDGVQAFAGGGRGGIATQQADAAAEAIAAPMGAAIALIPRSGPRSGACCSPASPLPTCAREIAGTGHPFETAANPLWWPPSKIAGRYLARLPRRP